MTALPFSAVVGQDDAKAALVMAAIEPRLGGVLLRGHKGSAKTTLARGLAALLPGDAPFVELPLGATEDRVLGALDLSALLTENVTRFRPGLLAAAHGGVLYVDEINLLADHLVDMLLDVAVTGVNRVEREGVSHVHPARFVLVASMNPEEGELRPQLLDRFGLAVDVEASNDLAERSAAVAVQLAAERDPTTLIGASDADLVLRERLATVEVGDVPADVVELASRVAVAVGAEGLRADLMLCRAASAWAGWEGRPVATADDVRRVASMVLAHRRRRTPFDEPGMSPDDLDDAFADEPPAGADALPAGADARPDEVFEPDAMEGAPPLPSRRAARSTPGRRNRADGPAGRFVRDVAANEATTSIAVGPTATALAARRAAGEAPVVEDLREAVRTSRVGSVVVIAVDASGSMGADRRIAAAKGIAFELLADAYQQRDRVALIAFRDDRAEVVLRPTGAVEIARARLGELAVGGTTPLADGLQTALDVASRARRDHGLDPFVVVITDGRATVGEPDPLAAVRAAAARISGAGVPVLVVDAETGPTRLGLAAELARHLGADCVPLDRFDAQHAVTAVRAARSTATSR